MKQFMRLHLLSHESSWSIDAGWSIVLVVPAARLERCWLYIAGACVSKAKRSVLESSWRAYLQCYVQTPSSRRASRRS